MGRPRVTVALAGEGSDELFGGYRRYQFEKAIRGLGALGRNLCGLARAARLNGVGWMPRRVQVVLRAMARRGAGARYSSYPQSEIPIETIRKTEWQGRAGVAAPIRDADPAEPSGMPASEPA